MAVSTHTSVYFIPSLLGNGSVYSICCYLTDVNPLYVFSDSLVRGISRSRLDSVLLYVVYYYILHANLCPQQLFILLCFFMSLCLCIYSATSSAWKTIAHTLMRAFASWLPSGDTSVWLVRRTLENQRGSFAACPVCLATFPVPSGAFPWLSTLPSLIAQSKKLSFSWWPSYSVQNTKGRSSFSRTVHAVYNSAHWLLQCFPNLTSQIVFVSGWNATVVHEEELPLLDLTVYHASTGTGPYFFLTVGGTAWRALGYHRFQVFLDHRLQ